MLKVYPKLSEMRILMQPLSNLKQSVEVVTYFCAWLMLKLKRRT